MIVLGKIIVGVQAAASLVAYWRSRDAGCLLVSGILGLSVLLCVWLHWAWLLVAGIGVSATILFLGAGWSRGR